MVEIIIGEKVLSCADGLEACNDAEKVKLAVLNVSSEKLSATMPANFSAMDIDIKELVVWKERLAVLFRRNFKTEKAFVKWWNGLVLSIDQLDLLKEAFVWTLEKPRCKPFDFFEFDGVKYLVVADRFEHTSAAEWTEGILSFIELSSADADDSSALDLLVATFCRPVRADLEVFKASEKWNGDSREPFNCARAKERALVFKDLDAGIKILLLWWYDVLINDFFEEYAELFGNVSAKKTDSDEETGKAGGRYADGRGYIMMLKNAAKKPQFGTFDEVQLMDVQTLWAVLLDDYYDENKNTNGNSSY